MRQHISIVTGLLIALNSPFVFAKSAENPQALKALSKKISSYPNSSMAAYKTLAKDEDKNDDKLAKLYDNQCVQDELYVREIELSLAAPLKNALLKNDFSKLADILDKKEKIPMLSAVTEKRSMDDIKELTWAATPQIGTVEELFKNISANFSKVEYVDMQITDYSVHFMNRREKDLRPTKIAVKSLLRLNGLDKSGHRRTDDLDLNLNIQGGEQKFTIDNVTLNSGSTRTIFRDPAFTEITASDDIAKLPVFLRREAIRRGGYALSYADVNGDGIPDLFVGMSNKTELLLGSKDGSFTEKKNSGLEDLRYVKTAVFADFRNKGAQDVIITLLDPSNERGDASVYYFQNDGAGKFTLKQKKFGGRILKRPMPAAVADFDGDGYLDFYVGYPGIRDFSRVNDNKTGEGRVGVQGVYLNDRNGGFRDYTEQSQVNKILSASMLYPHASLPIDYNQDGKVDLLVADDRNNLSPMYKNLGLGIFQQTAEEIGIGNNGFAMSLAAGDLNNDGVTDLLMTNVNFSSAHRLASACNRQWSVNTKKHEAGIRLFSGTGEGKFHEITDIAGLSNVGEGAGGMTLIDYNNDGLQDIYVVNGLWSGTPEGEDMESLFAVSLFGRNRSMGRALRGQDQMNFMQILSDLKGDVAQLSPLKVKADDKVRPSLAGFQRNRLFRNNGDGTFTEVGYLENVDSMADGYIAGRADFNKNGQMGLILRNADPGNDLYQFPVVQRFRNDYAKNKSVTLSFEGNASSKDGFGLYALAEWDKNKSVQHLIANSGSLQEDRVLHFGLGRRSSLDKLTIYWPSGKVQTLKDVKAGRQVITEPTGVAQASAK